jgi:hypothetical protein
MNITDRFSPRLEMQKGGREIPPAGMLIGALLSEPVTSDELTLVQQTTPLC